MAKDPGYSHLCTLCPLSPDPPRAVSQPALPVRTACRGSGGGRHRETCLSRAPDPLLIQDPVSQVPLPAFTLVSHAGMLSAKSILGPDPPH